MDLSIGPYERAESSLEEIVLLGKKLIKRFNLKQAIKYDGLIEENDLMKMVFLDCSNYPGPQETVKLINF